MPKSKFKIDEITLVLVVALLAIFVSLSNHRSKGNSNSMEAEKITELILDDHGLSFASGGVINENKLKEIQKMHYNEFKNSLNAKNDFCIYIEDENGNIILAKGAPKLSRDGLFCRE